MDSIDPQAQDTSPISNGVAEPATLSLPASPPQAQTPALSDPPRTAEQGKDGECTSFRFPLVDFYAPHIRFYSITHDAFGHQRPSQKV